MPAESPGSQALQSNFSDYIVYVDESGDPSLRSIDPKFPVFVLAFCVFKIDDYVNDVVPSIQRFKFKFFGHDMVILHEREIRKMQGAFKFLRHPRNSEVFFSSLNSLIHRLSFQIICVPISKERPLTEVDASDAYNSAMVTGLIELDRHLSDSQNRKGPTYIVFESRGKTEDTNLRESFERFIAQGNFPADRFAILFAPKTCNSTGIQLADLVARPLGLQYLRPGQANRAYEVLHSKLIN